MNRELLAESLLKDGVGLDRVAEKTGLSVPHLKQIRKRVRKELQVAASKSVAAESRLQRRCVCTCKEVDHGKYGDHSGVCTKCGPERREAVTPSMPNYLTWTGCNAFEERDTPTWLETIHRRVRRLPYNSPANVCPKCGQRDNWRILTGASTLRGWGGRLPRSLKPDGTYLTAKQRKKLKNLCPHPFHTGP